MTQRFFAICLTAIFTLTSASAAFAGTTGQLEGRVIDIASGAPLAGVAVSLNSPSQSASATSDAAGNFRFLSLAPDSYDITFALKGYDTVSQAGISVFADQAQTLNATLRKSITEIGHVTSRPAGDLLKAGTTSDVYSVNATVAGAAKGLIGTGGLTNAYGAVASVPGVAIDGGEQGWFQTVKIRGGDIDQVGYELDGIPVNRVYDNAPMTMLSSLGQQELQVYTGGTPASADAQGISGYINQVIRTGTYPGFGNVSLGIGSPTFYHHVSAEAGGASANRLFSYYIGLGGANQEYRFIDNSNGASQLNSFFYPVNLVDPNTFAPGSLTSAGTNQSSVYTGGNGVAGATLFASGIGFGIQSTAQRDAIANFHIGIPHKHDSLRDDVQLLYLTSEVTLGYNSSQLDFGPAANQLGQLTWDDSHIYAGALMAAPDPAQVVPYLFPSSPTQRAAGSSLPAALRDTNDNGVSVTKLQYQHNISSSAYLRLYGYMLYSNWFIWGPNTAAQPYYGAELADYEIPDHTYGGNLSYVNQINAKHLLTLSYGYTGSNLQRYDIGYIKPNYNVASFVGNDGNCYDPLTGNQTQCFGGLSDATINAVAASSNPLTPLPAAPPATPATLNGARWIMTNNYFYSGSGAALNQVHTRFSGLSLGDQWRPSDALNVNLGLRVENFRYLYGDTLANDPARQFWFTHYNQEFCEVPGQAPSLNPGGVGAACPAGSSSPGLSNPANPPDYDVARFEPRFGFTYTYGPNTVFRGSAGVYARPPNSSWLQYNVVQRDLPLYLGNHFAAFGGSFKTPEHNIRPDTSYNYDLSWEQRIKGTDMSFKLTPFYRATRDQLQNFFIDPQGGLESGLNVGNQVSSGVEFAFQKGDFNRDGLAAQFSYTHTNSKIKYQNFEGQGINVIDQLNSYISGYNAYTKTGGGFACYFYEAGGTAGAGTNNCAQPGVVTNPYYNAASQPLLDKNASYPTYDVIPGPFAGTNGYAVPDIATLLLNYKHKRLAITPSLSYSSGAEYGAPTTWPGFNPQSCYQPVAAWVGANGTAADPANCDDFGGLPLMTPDKYTGKFDNLGAFKQPWRISLSMGMSYDVTPRVKARLSFLNIIDKCGQRGYAWDNPNVCVYGALPSGVMAPAGNFYPNSQAAAPPPQMLYPYSFWLNNNNTGFVGVKIPMQMTFDLDFKI
ncbi:MAG: TonB-dependent receptor domain-containing protein [Candidatus Baltobacteraceae bacterium]